MHPDHLKYCKTHEWVRLEEGFAVIGITHYAQSELGDIVYVELPDKGRELKAEEAFGVVESVKAVSELFTPLSGVVEEVNGALTDQPEIVNQDCYGAGWMIRISLTAPKEVDSLWSAAQYEAFLEEQAA